MKVIKFSATWCAPCKAFASKFENVRKMEDFTNIEFAEMDIESDEAFESVEKYQIRSVPTVLILNDDGEINKKLLGNIPESDFVNIIKTCIAN